MNKILFLIFFVVQAVVAQKLSNDDFLKYQDKVSFHINGNLDSAFYYVNKIKLSKEAEQLTYAFASEAYLYQLKEYSDTLNSNNSFETSLLYLDKINAPFVKKKAKSKLLNFKGLINWKRKKLSDAINAYREAKRLAIEVDDKVLAVKCSNNMALILAQVGNFELAIKSVKESDSITDKIKYLYEKESFLKAKSSVYMKLGSFYEAYYSVNKKATLLDSSELYYKKTIIYSKNLLDRKLKAQINLGNIYVKKSDLISAEKQYLASLVLAQQSNFTTPITTLYYNLGYVNYGKRKYDKALIYFNKVDSLSNHETNKIELTNSMYYLAKIHNEYDDYGKAEKYLAIYKDKFKENENLIAEETLKVNNIIANAEIKEDLNILKNEIKQKKSLLLFSKVLIVSVFCGLIYFLYKNYKAKKAAHIKVNKLIEEFKQKKDSIVVNDEKDSEEVVINNNSLSIDEEKENEIVAKLIQLEKANYFLREDFNLQSTAKKIKTNTTYLSYVVNKRFEKSFSEYSNELKINYAIEQMITNATFRKYSTQAIAETVGFKNAVSFAKSFNKRTGVTPVQFIKKIEKDELV